MELETTSFRMFKTTKEKLERARHKMSKAMNYDSAITWDAFFDVLMNMYLSKIENSLESKFDLMKEEQSKVDILRSEIQECFKQQNNNIEELISGLVKQNKNMSLDIKSIQNFTTSMNDNLGEVIDSVKALLANIGDMTASVSQKISKQTKKYFGISVPFIMHYIIRDNNLLLKKSSPEEAAKEVSKVVNNYKNLYNSSDNFSSEDIDKVFNKLAMKGEE